MTKIFVAGALLCGAFGSSTTFAQSASAQAIDLSGEWATHNNEDVPDRIPGPELGDYTGLPINAAARQKAETWDPDVLSQPERQTQPHPAQYSSRGPGPNLQISKILDPDNGKVIGYHFAGYYGRADRTVWLDGRPHPSEKYGEHTWAGFSTGRWEGGKLIVTTTHMKMGVIQRNGVPSSPYGRMTEIYARHGSILMMTSYVDDPIYLEEPMVRSQTWELSVTQATVDGPPFEPEEELGPRATGWVPSYPMGSHHPDYAAKYGLPFGASLGGGESLYPEYRIKVQQMLKSEKK